MEKYYHIYNKAYEKFTPDWFNISNQKEIDVFLRENSESIICFLDSYFVQFGITQEDLLNKKILIAGCGLGGLCHYLAKKGAHVTGMDVSQLAIIGAKEIAQNKKLSIVFQQADLCHLDAKEKFDYIIDDHLLHCLTTNEDRENYLKFVANSLNNNGLFLLETMVFHHKLQTPVGYYFDENNILWQSDLGHEEVMIRKIASSIDIENQIINAGFKIHYLFYHAELAFQVFSEHKNFPSEYLPHTIRLAATPCNA